MSKKYYAALAKKRREDKKEKIQNLEKLLLDKGLSASEKSRIQKSIEAIKNPKKKKTTTSTSVWTVSGGLPGLGKRR